MCFSFDKTSGPIKWFLTALHCIVLLFRQVPVSVRQPKFNSSTQFSAVCSPTYPDSFVNSFSEVDECAHIPQETIKRPCLQTNPNESKMWTALKCKISNNSLFTMYRFTVSRTWGKFRLNSIFHLLMKLA